MTLLQRNRFNRRRGARKRALRVEVLRERVPLDGSGLGVADPLPWFDPGALTYSFAPDGTRVASEENQLFSHLAPLGAPDQWQAEFRSAFDAWLAPLGATINEVPDSGSRFGVSGRTQGDPRFGDIRIAAIPLSDTVLATSVPHSAMVQGTWAGDILINANVQWNSLNEVFAVAMHEFGHVLGLGHADDPQSPMFVHGVHEATAPTTADVQALRELYLGIRFENDDDESEQSNNSGTDNDDHGAQTDSQPFDFSQAFPLQPAIGSTLRYTATGSITETNASTIYRLEPALNEPEDLENLTIALEAVGTSRLIADVAIFDANGNEVESNVLHHGQGRVVVQATSVEGDEVYYVVASSSTDAPAQAQVGGYELVMDLVPELRTSREVGEIQLDQQTPVVDQAFTVASSRLVHLHVDHRSSVGLPRTVYVQLLDQAGTVQTQTAIPVGVSRSARLTFLPAGDYTMRFFTGDPYESNQESRLKVYLDEVSIDVGPGVANPTYTPYLGCDEPGADPDLCVMGYVPITPDPPTTPDPLIAPVTPPSPDWSTYGFSCTDYSPDEFEFLPTLDPLWWEFHLNVCQPAPPTTPGPLPVGVSPWQNPANKLDVSGDQQATSLDALLVLNFLADLGGEQFAVSEDQLNVFLDVNGDRFVTALDALLVINSLAQIQPTGEAEQISLPQAPPNADVSASQRDNELATDATIGLLF